MEKLTLTTGEIVTVSKDNIQLHDFYINLKSGFMGWCISENDAMSMNLVKNIFFRSGGKMEIKPSITIDTMTIDNVWVKLYPTKTQEKKIDKFGF